MKAGTIFSAGIAPLIIVWFVVSLVFFLKDRKNPKEQRSVGILINFVFSCVFLGIVVIAFVLVILFLLLTIAVISSM